MADLRSPHDPPEGAVATDPVDGSTDRPDAQVEPRHRGDDPDDEAGNRGSLEVRTRVLRTLVERAVLEVPGTVSHDSGLSKLPGLSSSKAGVEMHGRSARVSAQVACVWPCEVAALAEEVRRHVRATAARLSGVHISSVDVTVRVVSPDDVDDSSRRVE
ncbi:Asp23/Gls24 family envelope stress response protein [Nocardioides zeae]|uniref:Asp23/Gls24 family envelope stress response protein n=1 Tax=Nocardioides imazamoxiresistens TaxID=3231893 RepID=A0ABU3PXG0_9ACTN|nr:Asp23/Gls24 family envelope stress response protein [Nocardioides zeae]MDT9593502.1 Asp23/Gls24 family envelope stress response protein [Nocardioides zeae]